MYRLGIDLGGTNIAIGLCKDNKILDKATCPTVASRDNDEIIKDMACLAHKILERNNLTNNDIEYVGIAAPGTVNSRTGIIEYSNNIKMKNYPIVDAFKRYWGDVAVYIENDANAAALGEALAGAGKGAGSLIMITLGTGVGGGIIINRKIYPGGINTAGGELGHTVIVARGRPCTCGRLGCWEAYSSATALTHATDEKIRELKLKGIPSLLMDEERREGHTSARTAFNAMKRGDKYGQELVNA